MNWLIISLAVVNFSLFVALLWWAARLRQRLSALAPNGLPEPPAAGAATGTKTPYSYITIEILNPVAVASERSKLAEPLATLSPRLISRKVHEQAGDILKDELAAKGIEADIRVQHVA